jgi:hypothetical protein
MASSAPGGNSTNSDTPVQYTREITPPSTTLNKDAFHSLISILKKTDESPTFTLKTKTEQLTFPDIQFLANQKWPANIEYLRFHTGPYGRNINGTVYTSNILGSSAISLQDTDRDWVSARSDELTQFLAQNRNWHHLFHNIKYILVQAIAFAALLVYLSVSSLQQAGWGRFALLPILASIYLTIAIYGTLLPKVFPFLVLEPEQPSFYTRLRTAFKYLVPTVFAGLIVQAILISLS